MRWSEYPLTISVIVVMTSIIMTPALALPTALPHGYGSLTWGDGIIRAEKAFPGGHTVKLGEETIYRQSRTSGSIIRRTFGFKKGKLYIVAVSFNPRYVQTKGIENILAEQIKTFGAGTMDRSQAPHMLQYAWENADTLITFSYAPLFPQTTALRYEQKP